VALFTVSAWLENELKPSIRQDAVICAATLAILVAGCYLDGVAAKIAFCAIVLTCFCFLAWYRLLSGDERRRLATILRSV
jgi:hypothetical protein